MHNQSPDKFKEELDKIFDSVEIPENKPGKQPDEEREASLEKRKANLEFAIRSAFSGLSGFFVFRYPPCILLFLLFLAYMYVVRFYPPPPDLR